MKKNHQISILLIDDLEDDYYLIRHLLSECKTIRFKVDLCPTLKDARKHLSNNNYDVYLIDHQLEKTNGIEMLIEAKENGFCKPAILFTAVDQHELVADAISNGFIDALPKLHLSPMLLERSIRFAIEKNDYIQEIENREFELKSLLKFRELVTSISRKFIKGHGDTLDERVHSALGEIGEFLGVDRCRVYERSEEQGLKGYQTWSHSKFLNCRDPLVRLDYECYPTLLEKLATKNVVEIHRDQKSNLWETEIYEFVKSIGIEHMLLVPLFFNGEWLGALSFESHRRLDEGISKRALIELVSEILADVMERRENDYTLQKTKEEALKVSQLKTEFLSNMSHELRTPLNAILGMSEVLNDSGLSHEQNEYLSVLEKSANSLKFIFDDIFEYAHLDSRPMDEKVSSFHFEDLIKAKVSKFKNLCPNPVELNYLIDEGLKSLGEGDQESLSRILDHLMSNAVKFTEEGEISIEAMKCQDDSEKICIELRDTGIGIEEQDFKMIFDSFYQIDSTLTRSYSGTGLGLTIVKRMLEILNCDIQVKSEVGVGTTMNFTYPFKTHEFIEQKHRLHG
jgi:signal transduction histidine kinase/CheY-like chemotaxis protein